MLIGRALNIKEFECEVSILSEQEVHFYRNLQTKTKLNSRDLLKCSGKFEFNEDTCKLVALFDKMELKEIVRSKNEAAIVADEKMALLFQSTFKIGELDEVFDIYVPFLSMPVVVTVHTIQNPNSIATILWDNSFQIPNRQLFEVESSVSWECLGEALKMKFCAPKSNPVSVVPDAEIFSKEILQFLCKKALSQPNASTITWVKFCKDCLPDRIFTFWEWFYGAMKLIREHLCDLWNKNYILGFIDKLSAEQLLLESSPGTFLLRFSDSQIGKLTIASVNLDANSLKKVVHIQPMNFNNPRSLADFILSISQLKTLYPKTEKAVAFGNVSSKVTLVKGYVPIGLQLATDAPIPGASTITGQEDVNNLNENSSIRSPITSEDEPMVLEN